MRGPFEGVWNIIRFNWHFYALAAGVVITLSILRLVVADPYDIYFVLLAAGIAGIVLLSLFVSFYVYDLSDLYGLSWLNFLPTDRPLTLVTIHAGFDETSALLQRKFPNAHLRVFDFYNPTLHTEISIRRARKAYPPYPGTQSIDTSAIPLTDQRADAVFLILAAHEIRQTGERIRFFTELNRVLKPTGKIIVVEHLRDGANFLAYTIGFFHFLPQSAWLSTFAGANFTVERRFRVTPFVAGFVLQKNEHAP